MPFYYSIGDIVIEVSKVTAPTNHNPTLSLIIPSTGIIFTTDQLLLLWGNRSNSGQVGDMDHGCRLIAYV